MEDLIKALQIFLKYGNPDYPTSCNHDELFVDISPEKVLEEDLEMLRHSDSFLWKMEAVFIRLDLVVYNLSNKDNYETDIRRSCIRLCY